MNPPSTLPPPLPPRQSPSRPPPLPQTARRVSPRYSPVRRLLRVTVWSMLVGVLAYRFLIFRPEPEFRPGFRAQMGAEPRERGRPGGRAVVPQGKNQAEFPTNLWRIHLELTPKAEATLRGHHQQFRGRGELDTSKRPEVMLTVREGGVTYTNVAAHLKGAAGSFRPYDDSPAFTLNFSKHVKGQRFHGYSKISLNNSVQDPTLMNEMLSRELFRAAGVPVPRAHHGTVVVNGRDLGVYVVVEGWGKPFLKQHFPDVSGNLYDGGFVQDIDGNLTVVSGEDQQSHPGLERLGAAVRIPDLTLRWAQLSKVLDVDRFLTLLALDAMLCNWDGYGMNRNNYRIFHDRSTDKMVFMPHGLDQLFGVGRRMGVESTLEPPMRAQVAQAVMSTPAARKLYRARVAELQTNVFNEEHIVSRIREIHATLRPTLVAYHPEVAREHDRRVEDLIRRVSARVESVREQLNRPQEFLKFGEDRVARLDRWRPMNIEENEGRVTFEQKPGEPPGLWVRLRGEGSAGSWRTRVRLEEGSYRFEGRVRTRMAGAGTGGEGAYAGFRMSGVRSEFTDAGKGEWVPLRFEFDCDGPASEVELVAEAVGVGGRVEVEFDLTSLRLVRVSLPGL